MSPGDGGVCGTSTAQAELIRAQQSTDGAGIIGLSRFALQDDPLCRLGAERGDLAYF